jgi:hypothetical protein
MYDKMKKKGLIPAVDLEKMELNHTTMVGVTRPLDLDKYPLLRQQHKSFSRADWVIGKYSEERAVKMTLCILTDSAQTQMP